MFIPDHPSLPRDFARDPVFIPHLFTSSSTQTRDISKDYGMSNINLPKCAEIQGTKLNAAVSPHNKGHSCNADAKTYETGYVGLHGDTGDCAVVNAAPMVRRYIPRGAGGDQGSAPAAVAHTDTGWTTGSGASRQTESQGAPSGYINHPHYGWLPASTPYLARLAARTVR